MSPTLSKMVRDLEVRVKASRVTRKQRAIVEALREVGATKAADTIEDILNRQDRAVQDGKETLKYMKKAKLGVSSLPKLSQRP